MWGVSGQLGIRLHLPRLMWVRLHPTPEVVAPLPGVQVGKSVGYFDPMVWPRSVIVTEGLDPLEVGIRWSLVIRGVTFFNLEGTKTAAAATRTSRCICTTSCWLKCRAGCPCLALGILRTFQGGEGRGGQGRWAPLTRLGYSLTTSSVEVGAHKEPHARHLTTATNHLSIIQE